MPFFITVVIKRLFWVFIMTRYTLTFDLQMTFSLSGQQSAPRPIRTGSRLWSDSSTLSWRSNRERRTWSPSMPMDLPKYLFIHLFLLVELPTCDFQIYLCFYLLYIESSAKPWVYNNIVLYVRWGVSQYIDILAQKQISVCFNPRKTD